MISAYDGEKYIYVLNGMDQPELGEEHFELEPGKKTITYLSSPPLDFDGKQQRKHIGCDL